VAADWYFFGLELGVVFALGMTAGVGLAVVGFYAHRAFRSVWPSKDPGPIGRLLIACGNDPEACDRLIAAELHQSPTIPRDEAARRALVSLRRDSR
jgi:hypothetical protein